MLDGKLGHAHRRGDIGALRRAPPCALPLPLSPSGAPPPLRIPHMNALLLAPVLPLTRQRPTALPIRRAAASPHPAGVASDQRAAGHRQSESSPDGWSIETRSSNEFKALAFKALKLSIVRRRGRRDTASPSRRQTCRGRRRSSPDQDSEFDQLRAGITAEEFGKRMDRRSPSRTAAAGDRRVD